MIWVTCLAWSLIVFLAAAIRLRYCIDALGIILLIIGFFDLTVAVITWWRDEGRFFD